MSKKFTKNLTDDKILMKGLVLMTNKKVAVSKKRNSSIRKENTTIVNPRNYLYALLILVGGILIVWYAFSWYQVKREEKLMDSYLISTNTISSNITDINALTQVIQESPSSYFIYIGYREDEDVYKLEKDLKKIIDKYKLNDMFFYFDVTDLKEKDDNYLEEIKKVLKIDNLSKVPAIIYINNGEIAKENVLCGVKNTLLKARDLENLLEIYDFDAIN